MDDEKEAETEILEERSFIWRIPACCKEVMEGSRDYCDHTSPPKDKKRKNKAI